MKDYFNVLGVSQTAPDDEIKRAYRNLAMKHHPDRGGDQAKFQEIQEAYGILSDPQKRAEWMAHTRGASAGHPGFGGFQFNFGGIGEDQFGDIFKHFADGGFAKAQMHRRNNDLKVVIDLDLASTLKTQQKHVSVNHLNGSARTVTIDVPRGVNGNMQMKYAGHGDHSQPDLPPGDLYINFRIIRHPEFELEGIDLVKTIRVSCLDAITGTTLKIKTLEGTELEWKVPPGTQPNSKFRLGQHGLWNLNHPVRGTLIGVIQLIVPMDLTEEQLLKIEHLSAELKKPTRN
jgi:curved DNA-binding protein